jgi:hypothetical protein
MSGKKLREAEASSPEPRKILGFGDVASRTAKPDSHIASLDSHIASERPSAPLASQQAIQPASQPPDIDYPSRQGKKVTSIRLPVNKLKNY